MVAPVRVGCLRDAVHLGEAVKKLLDREAEGQEPDLEAAVADRAEERATDRVADRATERVADRRAAIGGTDSDRLQRSVRRGEVQLELE